MRRFLIGLFWLAACYQPVVPTNVPCPADGACPADQACINGFCTFSSSSVPDAAVGIADRDRDGVADDHDNCPDVANPDQANEDGDKFGDTCDPCPQISDSAPKDSDGDGIADACDPNPTGTTRDSRWLFEGFSTGQPNWPASAAWAAVGDHDNVRVTAPGGSNDMTEYLTLPLSSTGRTFDNFNVSVAFTIDQTTGTSGPEIGLSIFDEAMNKELDCTVYQVNGSANDRHLGLYDNINLGASPQFLWQTGTPYTLTVSRRGTTYNCTLAGASGQLQTSTGTSQVTPRSGGSVGLWAFGVTARVDWLFVAGTP